MVTGGGCDTEMQTIRLSTKAFWAAFVFLQNISSLGLDSGCNIRATIESCCCAWTGRLSFAKT